MPLTIKPVKLKQSIYLRVPSSIAHLIGIESDDEVTLTFNEEEKQFLLTYAVSKKPSVRSSTQPYETSRDHLTAAART